MFYEIIFSFTVIIFLVTFSDSAQFSEDIVWAKNGNSYYQIENNNIVQYQLPSLAKTVLVDSLKLVPKGQSEAIKIRSFSFSNDEKKILFFNNTKKVWRRNTRGTDWFKEVTRTPMSQIAQSFDLINAVRARSFAAGDPDAQYTAATLTIDELLNERAREFAYEMFRREDLIRFGHFTDAWWEKPVSDKKYQIFPIPLNVLTANPVLKQNPGY